MSTRKWDTFHRRGGVLQDVAEEADARLDGALPSYLPGVQETFADDLSLIAALQLRWHTQLSGRIERALMDQPSDLEAAVVTGWRDAAAALPGTRAILDAHAERPTSEEMRRALQTTRRKDWVLMAAMAGLAAPADTRAETVGRRLERRARAAYAPQRSVGEGRRPGSPSPGLVDRIKASIGAA